MTDGFIFSPTVMIILGSLIAIVVLAVLIAFFKDVFIAAFSKTKSVPATLTSKYEETYVTQKVYATGGSGAIGGGVASGVAEKGKEYFCAFQLDNGKYITLLVNKDFYDVILEEGKGTLTYKGKRFISFDGPTDGTRLRTDNNPNNFVGVNRHF
ncbi:MAG: DUF2500 family protein [Lachnospira sp.]|nr:DUF2500 family protein [Lachnospira sp.]